MKALDSISRLLPTPSTRPRAQPLPQRKPRKDKPDTRSQHKPRGEDTDTGSPHIDEYA